MIFNLIPPMADIPVALPLRTNIREYEIQELVGSGGFGFVYRAKDHTLQRSVALKEYFPASIATRGDDGQVKSRLLTQASTYRRGLESFLNEARVLAQFDDPGVVKVHRFWEQDGTAYMVMPFYDGITLRGLVRRHHDLITPAWLNAFIPRVLDILGRLHEAGTYHRDLSPENILVLESGGVVLLDFGSSRQDAASPSGASDVVLKPGYAPIEQYLADGSLKQGPWTDLYGIGAVLYFLLEGKAPPSSINRMQQDAYEPILNKRERYPGIAARLLVGIDRCLAVQAADRPQSVSQLKEMFAIDAASAPTDFSLYKGVDKVIQYAATGTIAVNNENDLTIPLDPITVLSTEIKPVQTAFAAMPPAPDPALDETLVVMPPDPLLRNLAGSDAEPQLAIDAESEVLLQRIPDPVAIEPKPASTARRPVTTEPNPAPVMQKKSRLPTILLGLTAFVLTSAVSLWLYLFMTPPLKANEQASADQSIPLKTSPGLGTSGNASPVVSPASVPPVEAGPPPLVSTDIPAPPAQALPDTTPAQASVQSPASSGPAAVHPAQARPVPPIASESVPPKAGVEPPPAPPPAMGVVRLNIKPWGKLSVNGQQRGASPPLNQLKLPPGKYRIEIANPGFTSYSRELEVLAGGTTIIKYDFE